MKAVSAKATYTENAKKLFGTRVVARELARRVLESRSSDVGTFVIKGHTLSTEHVPSTTAQERKRA